MGKVNLWPCITRDWNPLNVLNLGSIVIGIAGREQTVVMTRSNFPKVILRHSVQNVTHS